MKYGIYSLTLLFLLGACKKNPDEEFDRGAMLSDMASGVIIPAYATMAADLADLNTKAGNFSTSGSESDLIALKSSFESAYKTFQLCKMYDFGPASDYGIKAAMNTYPTDTVQINSNITAGTYVIGSAENVDAIGFPAIDYLLFHAAAATVITEFTTDAEASNRKQYLTDITAKMKSEFDLVKSQWASYQATFVAADGTDIGSSSSLLFNEFVKDIELLKNAKIGIPSGQFSGGAPLPEMFEGYYSGLSKELVLENVTGLKACFNGGSSIGFDDYLNDVQGETPTLAADINAQFDLITTKLTALNDPYSTDISSNQAAFFVAYEEIKKLVTYTKTDMSSTLGLLITFSDADGD